MPCIPPRQAHGRSYACGLVHVPRRRPHRAAAGQERYPSQSQIFDVQISYFPHEFFRHGAEETDDPWNDAQGTASKFRDVLGDSYMRQSLQNVYIHQTNLNRTSRRAMKYALKVDLKLKVCTKIAGPHRKAGIVLNRRGDGGEE